MTLTTDDAPPPPAERRAAAVRRGWIGALRGGVLLTLVLGGYWLVTPHLASDQSPESVGRVPAGCSGSLSAGQPVLDAGVVSCESPVRVTNHGLLPVTLTAVRAAVVTGPGEVSIRMSLDGGQDSPVAEQVTLGRGEELVLWVQLRLPPCTQTGGSESLTTLNEIELTAAIGPVTRRATVAGWMTGQVSTDDGSNLQACVP